VSWVIRCRRTIEDLRRISRLVGKWEEQKKRKKRRRRQRSENGERYNTSIDLSVQSRDQVDFEIRRKRFDDLLSAGRFSDWKAQGSRWPRSLTVTSVLQPLRYSPVLLPYLSTELAAYMPRFQWMLEQLLFLMDGLNGDAVRPWSNPQPLSRYARRVNRIDGGLMRPARPLDRKRRFLIVRGLISRDHRLQINDCTLLNNIVCRAQSEDTLFHMFFVYLVL